MRKIKFRGKTLDGRVLVGCLTGQLEWSTEEPTKDEEEANED